MIATVAASRAGLSVIAVLRLGRVLAACGTEFRPACGEDLDAATIAVAADSPTSVFLLAAVVAGFVLLSI